MLLKLNNFIKLIKSNISLNSVLYRGNQQRLKLKVDITPTNDTKTLDLKASKNRELWEKQNELLNQLKGRVCSDDVYFVNEYEAVKHNLTDAISMHKEYCLEPSMLDAPYAILKAHFLLNTKTKKTTKFIQKIGGIVLLPHKLDFIEKRKILAFSKNVDDIEIALKSGAMDAGDESLVKKLEQGLINYEEFDQVVCHIDALQIVSKLRPILKDKLPVKQTPRVGTDIKSLVESYVNGYEYESKKVEGIIEEAHLTVPLGQISWNTEKLIENYLAFVGNILNDASTQISGDVIVKSTLTCPPSDEIFALDVSKEVEKMLKKSKLKRSVETEVEEVD